MLTFHLGQFCFFQLSFRKLTSFQCYRDLICLRTKPFPKYINATPFLKKKNKGKSFLDVNVWGRETVINNENYNNMYVNNIFRMLNRGFNSCGTMFALSEFLSFPCQGNLFRTCHHPLHHNSLVLNQTPAI